jgi:hypothetical protein
MKKIFIFIFSKYLIEEMTIEDLEAEKRETNALWPTRRPVSRAPKNFYTAKKNSTSFTI